MGSVGTEYDYSKSNFVKRATTRAQNSYDVIYSALQNDPSLLEDLDITDTELVQKYARTLIDYFSPVPGGPACYAVAGAVSAILDKSGESNEIIAGITKPNSTETTSSVREPNHVWVRSKYGIYEYFRGYSNEQLTQHIERTKIELKRKK